MEAPTFRRRDDQSGGGGAEYFFAPRTVEKINSSQIVDSQFDQIFDKLSKIGTESHEENILSACGALIGKYIFDESQTRNGEIDEIRGLAAFQGFFERELIKRGDGISHYFRNPSFFSAVNREAPFAHAERITEKIVGAQSTHAYVEQISKNKNVVFIGSEIDFDVKHAIDLVVGLSKAPEDDSITIDEVWLVQVKTSMPQREKIEAIRRKHTEYAKALKEFEGRGVGTDESEHFFSKMEKLSTQESVQKFFELDSFYKTIIDINSTLEPTWESLVEHAKKYNFDPILFYIRIKLINDTRLSGIGKVFKKNALYMAQEKIKLIDVPQEEFSRYNRLTRAPAHITTTKKVRSIIIAQGREVINEVIM